MGTRADDQMLVTLDSDSDFEADFKNLDSDTIRTLIEYEKQKEAALNQLLSVPAGHADSMPASASCGGANNLGDLAAQLQAATKRYEDAGKEHKAASELHDTYVGKAAQASRDEPAHRAAVADRSAAQQEVAAEVGDEEELDEELERHFAERRRKERSLDICFLVDNTGSMDWCIDELKTKIGDICDHVLELHPNAILRLSYVGYRDHGDNPKFELMPFVSTNPVKALKAKLRHVRAFGGGDGPEDVVGGLQQAALLEWSSSTRLVIHFGDYPAHGRWYTDLPDDYPDGDPQGLTCEQFLAELCSKRVDYHFARITDRTDRMVALWKANVFDHAKGCKFEEHDSTHKAEDFAPLVLRSISSSMSRSSYFSGPPTDQDNGQPGHHQVAHTGPSSKVGKRH